MILGKFHFGGVILGNNNIDREIWSTEKLFWGKKYGGGNLNYREMIMGEKYRQGQENFKRWDMIWGNDNIDMEISNTEKWLWGKNMEREIWSREKLLWGKNRDREISSGETWFLEIIILTGKFQIQRNDCGKKI